MQFEWRTVASAEARHLRPDTDEPAEQRGHVLSGGWGGKGVDQGEHRSITQAPDTERETHVPGMARGAASFAATHPR